MRRSIEIIFLILFVLLFILPFHQARATTTPTSSEINIVAKTVRDKTPSFISKPIIFMANTVEEFRVKTGVETQTLKESTQAEIKVLTTDKTSIKAVSGASDVVKPVKYVKLYFFTVVSFIFNHVFVFYGIFIFLLFYIARFFWRLVF